MADTQPATAESFFSKVKSFFIGNSGPGRKKNKEKTNKTKTSYEYGCCFFVVLVIFIFSTLGCIIMWFTDLYLDSILNQMTLKNGTEIFEAWQAPPIKPLICVHIFNYTNMEDYTSGRSSKIHVNDTGPYCYRETLWKTDIHFYDNGTVSYGDRRSHVFEERNSTGRRDDMVIVPNLPLIGAVAAVRDYPNVFRSPIDFTLRVMGSKTMIKVPAHEFIFGYDDTLMSFVKGLSKFADMDIPIEKFGILAMRAAETKDRITVKTGSEGLDSIGVVTAFNGENQLHAWDSDECNRLDGSDGAFFPRHEINESATLYLFHKDLCRKLPLVYQKEVDFQDGVRGMRFHIPPDAFNTTGTCYCKDDHCSPAGVFDVSPCAMGVPVMMSFPHFLNAEPSVTEPLEGMRPDPKKHDFFIDIQPILGFTLGTVSRIQLNIQVRKSEETSLIKEFPDGIILPVVWFEVTADRLPPDLFAMIFHASVTVQWIQWSLQWGMLTVWLCSVCALPFCRRPSTLSPPPNKEVVSIWVTSL